MLKLNVVICAGWFSPHAGDMHSLCEYYDLYGARKCLAYQHSSLTVVNLWRSSTTEIFDGIKKCSEFNPKKLNLPKHPKPETRNLKGLNDGRRRYFKPRSFPRLLRLIFSLFYPEKKKFFSVFRSLYRKFMSEVRNCTLGSILRFLANCLLPQGNSRSIFEKKKLSPKIFLTSAFLHFWGIRGDNDSIWG